MREKPEKIPVELNNWLRVATLNLEELSRKKVCKMAVTHFFKVVNQEIASGTAETEAYEKAARALGDPWLVRSERQAMEEDTVSAGTECDRPIDEWHDDIFEPLKKWRRWRALPEPVDLDSWLAIATFDLCRESKTRVRSEIGAHYVDALAASSRDGCDETQAGRNALMSLGSARSARKHFRKIYLTQFQYRTMLSIRRDYRPLGFGITKLTVAGLIGFVCIFLPRLSILFAPALPLGYLIFTIFARKGLEHIKSHYILNYSDINAEKRLKFSLGIIYSIFVVGLILASLIPWEGTTPQPSSVIELVCSILFVMLIFIIAFHYDVKRAIFFIRYLRGQNRSIKSDEPDSYA